MKASRLGEQHIAKHVNIPDNRKFIGFDAYKKVIAESDVVRLATPPHFRPIHLQAAGRTVTWDQALNSQEDLSSSGYTWDAKPSASPIAIPGVTQFV